MTGEERSERELWGWFDARTGARVSVGCCLSRESAEEQIALWRRRDARGGRPDLHDLMPHLVAAPLSSVSS